MKIRLRSLVVGAAALVIATGVALAGGGVANAADVTPAYEPDANSLGGLTLYNASGAPITSGSVNDSPFVAFAAASGPGRAGDNRAFLRVATPKASTPTDQFLSSLLSSSSVYPNPNAPAPINTFTNPVASLPAGAPTLASAITANPNTETAANLANIYQIRLITTAAGQSANPQYFSVDVLVDQTAGTWRVIYPTAPTGPADTTTSISANPANSAPAGTQVTLSARVTPTGAAGSVHFFDGATDLGAATYNATTGDATLAATPAAGSHSFTAAYTPSDANAFKPSTSQALPYTIGTPTSTTLTATPPSGSKVTGSNTTLDLNLTANVTPVGTAGGVHFFDGTTDLGAGTYSATTGVATLTKALAIGNHPLIATFTPTAAGFTGSSSSILNYAVAGANSAAVPLDAQNNSEPFAGSLVLQVATGTAVHLTQVPATDPNGHPVQATDPTGHRHAWVFTGNLTGVSVNDTRPAQNGWTVTGQATDFANGGTTVTASNLGWTPALAGGDAEGTVTPGTAVASKLKTATSDGLHTSSTLASTAAGNGLGTQNLSSALELRIPDTSPTGLYTSTLTLTLVSP